MGQKSHVSSGQGLGQEAHVDAAAAVLDALRVARRSRKAFHAGVTFFIDEFREVYGWVVQVNYGKLVVLGSQKRLGLVRLHEVTLQSQVFCKQLFVLTAANKQSHSLSSVFFDQCFFLIVFLFFFSILRRFLRCLLRGDWHNERKHANVVLSNLVAHSPSQLL